MLYPEYEVVLKRPMWPDIWSKGKISWIDRDDGKESVIFDCDLPEWKWNRCISMDWVSIDLYLKRTYREQLK